MSRLRTHYLLITKGFGTDLGFIRFWDYVPLKVSAESKIMFFNNANCDVYIGTGAGKKLIKEIENAKRSVKIVSPFLSPFLIKRLIGLHSKGIDVQLITTDTIEDFYGSRERNLHKLIRQKVHIDGQARRARKKWKTLTRVLNGLTIALFIAFVVLNYCMKGIRLLGLLVPLFLFILIVYETRVRLNDATSVQKIVEEFDFLMNDSRMPEVGIQEWGGLLYREPIN